MVMNMVEGLLENKQEKQHPKSSFIFNTLIRFSNPEAYKNLVKLMQNKKKTRKDLCNDLNLPPTTVYDILRKMIISGQVVNEIKDENRKGKRGRARIDFMLTDEFLNSLSYKKIIKEN